MTQETLDKAKELESKIKTLKYEIQLLNEQIDSNNLLIRFGGNFNVSAPIEINSNVLLEFCNDNIFLKETELIELKKQLENL